MKEDDMLFIKVPASTANLGPGFDSIGLAVSLYLNLEVEIGEHWEVIPLSKEMEQFPTNEQHLICKIAIETGLRYGVHLPPCKIRLKSEIPLARGLGSSAAAIVAGIELANIVGNLQLSKQEKLAIATEIEGHPDNVGASIFGGLVVGCNMETQLDVLPIYDLAFEAVVVVPKEELLTTASREILPKELPFQEAVQAGAVGNVLVAALLTRNWSLAGKMMSQDLYHQPYRRKLVPLFAEVERVALKKGAFGVALSGAGPTIICFAEQASSKLLTSELEKHFSCSKVTRLTIDQVGCQAEITSTYQIKKA